MALVQEVIPEAATVEAKSAPAHVEQQRLRERLAPVLTSINEGSRKAYFFADRQMHAHPWISAGTTFALGMMFGALLAMAARRH